MKVLRAHSYDDVAAIKRELSGVPSHWLDAIRHVGWHIYPQDLSPLYTGLLESDDATHDGRMYSQVGGWFHPVGERYIFKRLISEWATVHEAAHALADALHVPVEQFYKPEQALWSYMASNPDEYFACAVDAFLVPERENDRQYRWWNNHDLARHDIEMWRYLNWLKDAC